MPQLVNLNGKILNEDKASISINNRSFRYGDGFFETIRITNGKIPLWRYHWERLSTSLEILQFKPPSYFTVDYLGEQVLKLAQKNGHDQLGRIRLTIFRGDGGLHDPINFSPNYLIQTWALNDALQQFNTNGLVCGIYEKGFKSADFLASIKSNNYLLYAVAALYAKENQWNDALILNHRGELADTTIANLFIVKNEQIITTLLADGPVAGTLRRYLLEHGIKKGYDFVERSILPQDLQNADELFLTNAIYGIKWVQSVGEVRFDNRLTARLYHELIIPLWNNKVLLNGA